MKKFKVFWHHFRHHNAGGGLVQEVVVCLGRLIKLFKLQKVQPCDREGRTQLKLANPRLLEVKMRPNLLHIIYLECFYMSLVSQIMDPWSRIRPFSHISSILRTQWLKMWFSEGSSLLYVSKKLNEMPKIPGDFRFWPQGGSRATPVFTRFPFFLFQRFYIH